MHLINSQKPRIKGKLSPFEWEDNQMSMRAPRCSSAFHHQFITFPSEKLIKDKNENEPLDINIQLIKIRIILKNRRTTWLTVAYHKIVEDEVQFQSK